MKYEIGKSNNLRYELKQDEKTNRGFIKLSVNIDGNPCVGLVSDIHNTNILTEEVVPRVDASTTVERFYEVIKEENFRIIPRDPNTYSDWQVGDIIKVIDSVQGGKIMAVRGSIVAVKWIGDNEVKWYLKSYIDNTCELRLTDYEKYIREQEDAKPPKCKFRKGDKVLVRDGDLDDWLFGIFEKYEDNDYYVEFGAFSQCMPYNSETWKYLGTEDNITEEVKDLC